MLIDFEVQMKSTLEEVKKLWCTALLEDEEWHYTLEGTHIDLRVSPTSIPAVEKYFKENNIFFKKKGEYKDPQEIVDKYQKCFFEKLFHIYCMFAIRADVAPKKNGETIDGEYSSCLERVVHMFANAHEIPLHTEAVILNHISFGRIFTAGFRAVVRTRTEK
uniref:Uncharacterized protein n=1 Tax=viral metagenome TaxID=1070528 RepID=A0A6M3LPY8_9ZZZZ